MSELRLKGLETTISFGDPDGAVESIKKVLSHELIVVGEILTEEYLGENEPDFDSINMGINGRCDVHLHDPSIFEFFQKVVDKRNRAIDAAAVFSASTRFRFPTGRTRRALVLNIEFGDLPIKLASRKAYATTTLDYKAKRVKWV